MSNISHIPKELSYIYADELYDEVKRLERQLAEAKVWLERVESVSHQCAECSSFETARQGIEELRKLKEKDQ